MLAALSYQSDGAAVQRHAFAYQRSPDQDASPPAHHPVVVVGAGPVGLSLAIDLAQRGQPVLLLDNDHRLSSGSRAICFAKRTLEIWDRLGVGQPMCDKGVQWNVGKVFFGERQVYRFDLLPEPHHGRPAFINLQQYYAEAYLAVRAAELPLIDLRWRHSVVGLVPNAQGVRLDIDTPEGHYQVDAAHVVACDGSRSSLRAMLGQSTSGQTFKDRFLIADVRLSDEVAQRFPAERWFWFDPPFHPGQSVLLHRQPDQVWRIDFQLGWDADPDIEKQPERIKPRVDAMMRQALGHTVPFALEWASVYTFACQRMASFRHGPVLFAGDAAHGVSPFGARGANSGVQDADNLGWKLDAVLRGVAGEALLNSYASEREAAADENILNSSRATDFITPKSAVSQLFRDATLALARAHAFARKLVNSGRLSVPAVLHGSPLNTADVELWPAGPAPGAVALDAPLDPCASASANVNVNGALSPEAGAGGAAGTRTETCIETAAETGADARTQASAPWLLQRLNGPGFHALVFGDQDSAAPALVAVRAAGQGLARVHTLSLPADGLAAQRYGALPGSVYLLRPDQHVCARWRQPEGSTLAGGLAAALRRALALA